MKSMISKPLKIALGTLIVGAGGGALAVLHLSNAQLRSRLAAIQQRNQSVIHLRSENEQVKDLLARTRGDGNAAAQTIHVDLERARRELAEAENNALTRHAQLVAKSTAEVEALATNRDPQNGLTRLEHFQNLGQATPGAAFQTLVWAAMKGDDTMLRRVSTINMPARAQAEALIAGLPESTRGEWTPEKLAAMFFTGAFNEVTAAQVSAETARDSQHVAMSVRLTGGMKETTVPLLWQIGVNGWQVVFDEKLLGAVQKRIANAHGPAPANKK